LSLKDEEGRSDPSIAGHCRSNRIATDWEYVHIVPVASTRLEVLTVHRSGITLEFKFPSTIYADNRRRITACQFIWIHPDHNAEFRYYVADGEEKRAEKTARQLGLESKLRSRGRPRKTNHSSR
jgi:hypothetical protein